MDTQESRVTIPLYQSGALEADLIAILNRQDMRKSANEYARRLAGQGYVLARLLDSQGRTLPGYHHETVCVEAAYATESFVFRIIRPTAVSLPEYAYWNNVADGRSQNQKRFLLRKYLVYGYWYDRLPGNMSDIAWLTMPGTGGTTTSVVDLDCRRDDSSDSQLGPSVLRTSKRKTGQKLTAIAGIMPSTD
ncbi:hypothetical protein A3709_19590 [Halioglobus sp. HI00S01]|nr:hypothetical protein A3709_19590 [Halioglobus sp. HI00S01]